MREIVENQREYASAKEGNICDEICRWIKSDIEKVIEICKEREIKIIFQNYPKDEMKILRTVAANHSIPFIDNYKKYLLQQPYLSFISLVLGSH